MMKKLINYIVIFTVTLAITSCGSEASLQKYYIDNQDNKNFISVDIPASILSLKEDVTPDVKQAYASVKKLNVLAFAKNESNGAEYALENEKVKKILKNSKFKELIRMNDKGRRVVVKYEGDDDSMDEVIVYTSSKADGFALIRVLGDDMTAEKIMKIAKSIQDVDGNNSGLKQLGNFIKMKSNN